MAAKKQVIRIVFDVLDERNHSLFINGDLSITAADPDEAIDQVFTQMQQQFNRPDIRLTRVRICA
ncbi:hypothetical protein [Spirosoma aerolatum]|uniref:hypothetical protein n=1 Tax=Spirosoma aerolatum TaxID=1211326 RepID=UPI0009AE5E96|nr:hypothetical protein [Spirosoma aerolatum]